MFPPPHVCTTIPTMDQLTQRFPDISIPEIEELNSDFERELQLLQEAMDDSLGQLYTETLTRVQNLCLEHERTVLSDSD